MRLPTKYYPIIGILVLLLQGCMSPQRDLARFMVPGPDEEPVYKEKAEEFIRYVQAGDVQQMLRNDQPVHRVMPQIAVSL